MMKPLRSPCDRIWSFEPDSASEDAVFDARGDAARQNIAEEQEKHNDKKTYKICFRFVSADTYYLFFFFSSAEWCNEIFQTLGTSPGKRAISRPPCNDK